MAAIDKIYVKNSNEYLQFKEWCEKQPSLEDKYGKKVSLSTYLYDYEGSWIEERPIFNAPRYVDAYVIRNCPFDFIQRELMLNYGHWSQEDIRGFYNKVKDWDTSKGKCPYWAKLEDFIFLEDGTINIKGLEESDYSKIKKGALYSSPVTSIKYTVGKHFKCTKHPLYKWNTPFKTKMYFIDVNLPEEMGYMWYHRDHNSWDFSDEFVLAKWSSSTAHCKTIKALKRLILKWKLPIGTIVKVRGRYTCDDYEFVVNKLLII